MKLSGKVALVTGGTSGLGTAQSRLLASEGARVIIGGREEGRDETLLTELRTAGAEVTFVRLDVTKPAEVEAAFAFADDTYGGVDILVANAGIGGPTAALVDVSLEDWQAALDVNLTGPFLCCQSAVPRMQRKGWGRIVVIGSTTGKRPMALRTPYAASKLGLVGLARSLAHEVGRSGITVNVISPYDVEGPRIEGIFGRAAARRGVDTDLIRQEETARTAIGRLVFPEDVARTVLFLCSDEAAAITGQDVNVSAGAVMY
jgi:NAD(P)-dependent dehydrogenase (short-subunit alcohol dehydrogenase family)